MVNLTPQEIAFTHPQILDCVVTHAEIADNVNLREVSRATREGVDRFFRSAVRKLQGRGYHVDQTQGPLQNIHNLKATLMQPIDGPQHWLVFRIQRLGAEFDLCEPPIPDIQFPDDIQCIMKSKKYLTPDEASRLESFASFSMACKTIRTYPKGQVPSDIQGIINGQDYSTQNIENLNGYMQARDTLVVWKKIIREPNQLGGGVAALQEGFSGAFDSYETVTRKADDFSDWLETNRAQLANLQKLDLSNNQLSSVPPEIGQLTNLQELSLRGNQLTSVPPEIGQLTNLLYLGLSNNQLTELPPELGQLTSLLRLSLCNNQLTELPAWIGQLTNLSSLILSENRLASVPAWIRQLTNLRGLFLDDNQLTSVPAEVGQLTALRCLNLGNNQLTSVPAELGQLTNLDGLYLGWNQLTSVPAEIGQLSDLRTLDLSNNQLTSLSAELSNLTNLRLLHLDNNQLTSLPVWVDKDFAHLTLWKNKMSTANRLFYQNRTLVGRVARLCLCLGLTHPSPGEYFDLNTLGTAICLLYGAHYYKSNQRVLQKLIHRPDHDAINLFDVVNVLFGQVDYAFGLRNVVPILYTEFSDLGAMTLFCAMSLFDKPKVAAFAAVGLALCAKYHFDNM